MGQRVKVGADVDEDGSLIARKVEGPQPRTEVRGTRVEIAGAVDEVRDGALIVNGISVAISPLTEIDEAPRPGDFVTVEAVVTSAGAVTAREVSSPEFTGAAEKPGPSPVGLKARFSK